ncbi:hypothetical protein [Pleionea sp. CnH1-48]|uniref:hypothetical protein n=1 Tax=Pleionea sp. CnH1-48 TaxID=2954494 RepID=UPI0020969925|nr:hypothetical protein [Pleionea sp. CnH1-48]MCO7224929.1 hypothetical protein [Pleionea sp. CnH1-48]
MKMYHSFVSLIIATTMTASASAEVETRGGVYTLQCSDVELDLKVAYGIGSVEQSAGAIIGDVDGSSLTIPFAISCTDDSVFLGSTGDLEQEIVTHCSEQLSIPDNWPFSCASIARDVANWAKGIEDNISQSLYTEYTLDIGAPRNWLERWLGIHPSTLDTVRLNGDVKTRSTKVYNSGKFDITNKIRYPFIAGINQFSCLGGLVDVAKGQLHEQDDGSHTGTAHESNEAGILCTRKEGDKLVAAGITLDLDKYYTGIKVQSL